MDQTYLAVVRTRLALERTLMAWVRTSAALITFGFTLYKAEDTLIAAGLEGAEEALFGVSEFSVGMLATGMLSLSLATVQHLRQLKRLREVPGYAPDLSVSLVVALIFLVLGAIAISGLAP